MPKPNKIGRSQRGVQSANMPGGEHPKAPGMDGVNMGKFLVSVIIIAGIVTLFGRLK